MSVILLIDDIIFLNCLSDSYCNHLLWREFSAIELGEE